MHFPASQRVTYLYYLGRYLFANNLFYPAHIALQAAYEQCHRQAFKQRNLILTYLIPCNIIMGRFPSKALLQRPEAQGLAEQFEPLCRLIVRGDYLAFREYLSYESQQGQWFARKGILLTLRNRCEILVWRSFCRKVFIHGGFLGDPQAQGARGPPPFLYLHKLLVATNWLQTRSKMSLTNGTNHAPYTSAFGSQIISHPTDPDYIGLKDRQNVSTNGTHDDHKLMEKYGDYLAPTAFFDEGGYLENNVSRELIDGVPDSDYSDYSLDPYAEENILESPSALLMGELESILVSLLTQGLIRGYLTHRNPRFAIPGARLRGALPTGFPNVWETIGTRESEDDSVPGWVKPAPAMLGGSALAGIGGRVVNLSGARPVGLQ